MRSLVQSYHYNPATSYIHELKKSGYSILRLAHISGIAYSTLHRNLTGKTRSPHSMTFKRLLCAYCYLLNLPKKCA